MTLHVLLFLKHTHQLTSKFVNRKEQGSLEYSKMVQPLSVSVFNTLFAREWASLPVPELLTMGPAIKTGRRPLLNHLSHFPDDSIGERNELNGMQLHLGGSSVSLAQAQQFPGLLCSCSIVFSAIESAFRSLLFLPYPTQVVSGGVASNAYLRNGLQMVCEQNTCHLVCPPPHLCTDNGIMIAWYVL